MTRAPALLLLLGLLLLGLTPVLGQDAERGLIVAGNPIGEANMGPLNPLLCADAACRLIDSLLFPTLMRVDPQTRALVPATDTEGLAESWTLDGSTATFHLRADRTWSDGTPITADDVYFSYRAALSDRVASPYEPLMRSLIRAVAPLDAATVAFVLKTTDCAGIDQINLPIVPAHAYGAAPAKFNGGDVTAWYDAQLTGFSTDFLSRTSDANTQPRVTAGPFQFAGRDYDQDIRLLSADGLRAFKYVDVDDEDDAVNRFLRGELNLLVDPPYERRQDLRASNEVTALDRPGNAAYALWFNLTDPNALDADGRPLPDSQNPFFADPNVRRAVQLAFDVPEMIDITVQGNGTPLASALAPSSWAYEAGQPVTSDPMTAAFMLEQAGWKDLANDGQRECIGCLAQVPDKGFNFQINLAGSGLDQAIYALMERQLRRVGVSPYAATADDPDFDAVLVGEPLTTPDPSGLRPAFGDAVYSQLSRSLLRSDTVTVLHNGANQMPLCDVPTRAALYAQAQQGLRDETMVIPLFSPNRMLALRGDALTLQSFVEEIVP